ncbi:probable ATP-dependent RNA helicase ddx42 [Contarinia nasturtii]|uniref:probable ATP-dependent RNA helicase ddx42 n=1 Tax=Contarinia nasturtii TaxID=265458 RepID=UPI0012D40A45|nr:probable ATP-dependent RNA helicase ddx42 [Contarinia nasturtii]
MKLKFSLFVLALFLIVILDYAESKNQSGNYEDNALDNYGGSNKRLYDFNGNSKNKEKKGSKNKRQKINKRGRKGENRYPGYGQFIGESSSPNNFVMNRKNAKNRKNSQYRGYGENNRSYQNWMSNDGNQRDDYSQGKGRNRNTIENMTVDELDQRIKKKVKKHLQKWNDKNQNDD